MDWCESEELKTTRGGGDTKLKSGWTNEKHVVIQLYEEMEVVSIIQLDRSMVYILNNSLADLLYYIHTCTNVYIYDYKYIYYIAGLHRKDNSQGGRFP